MGTIGSKEKLSQFGVIYGYNCKDFPWKNHDDRNVYHATGLIISSADKKYVITTRSRLIGCSNLVMYHSYFNEQNAIFRNDLHIIFQSIEFNIIILATVGKLEFDITSSELISGEYDNKVKTDSYDLLKKELVVPTTRSQYYTTIMDLDLETKDINYRIDIFNAKFNKSFVFDQTFLPANYLYEFYICRNKKTPLYGIYGAAIYNKKLRLIGMVVEMNDDILYVLPTKVLQKIVLDFVSDGSNYNGFQTLPFSLKISKKDIIVSATDTEFNKKDLLKIDDKVLSIDGKEIMVLENNHKKKTTKRIVIYDNDYKNFIPVDIYYRLNFRQNQDIDLVISRDKISYNVTIPTVNHKINSFPLTSQSYYLPKFMFPYLNINGIIIVELTHELIDMLALHDISIHNNIVSEYLNNKLHTNCRYSIIIDCLNNDLAKKYNLLQWNIDKERHIVCPTIKSINQKSVCTIDDVQRYTEVKDNGYTFMLVMPNDECKEIII